MSHNLHFLIIFRMRVAEFIGLQFFESAYLFVLFCIPIVVAQKYIGTVVLLILISLAISTLLRKLFYKPVDIKGQGVLITGCDTGQYWAEPGPHLISISTSGIVQYCTGSDHILKEADFGFFCWKTSKAKLFFLTFFLFIFFNHMSF